MCFMLCLLVLNHVFCSMFMCCCVVCYVYLCSMYKGTCPHVMVCYVCLFYYNYDGFVYVYMYMCMYVHVYMCVYM